MENDPQEWEDTRSPHQRGSSFSWKTCRGIEPQVKVCDWAPMIVMDGWQQGRAGRQHVKGQSQTPEVSSSDQDLPWQPAWRAAAALNHGYDMEIMLLTGTSPFLGDWEDIHTPLELRSSHNEES